MPLIRPTTAKSSRRNVSAATRAKLSIALRGNKNSLGFRHTDETRRNMSLSKRGKMTAKQRAASPMQKGVPSFFKGRRHTDESRLQMSLTRKARYALRPKYICRYCKKEFDASNHAKHQQVCKLKKTTK